MLYGLVLAGGKSTRMRTDKSLLQYHGKSQIKYCFDLLLPLCERVFVSNREDQTDFEEHKNLPQIHDVVANIGPLGGMLSAMTQYPNAAWLILACDLPFVNQRTLKNLIENRDPYKIATSYQSASDGLPEPLCAIYEPKSVPLFLQFLNNGQTCPRKILMNANTHLIDLREDGGLANINSPEEYQHARYVLKGKKFQHNGNLV